MQRKGQGSSKYMYKDGAKVERYCIMTSDVNLSVSPHQRRVILLSTSRTWKYALVHLSRPLHPSQTTQNFGRVVFLVFATK